MNTSIEEFGRHLLDSNDLDPAYVAFTALDWPAAQAKRWLVAYWCWYDCGAASWLSERAGGEFWAQMLLAAANAAPSPAGTRWPRGKERRHARGAQGERMVRVLSEMYPAPEAFVDFVSGSTCAEVMARVKKHYLFGDWIAFKVADMLDRCMGCPVQFNQAETFMFEDPTKAAFMLWRERTGQAPEANPRDRDSVLREVVNYLGKAFEDYKAPPLYDRPVGLQEIETILCKWKSHRNGKYPFYNDQREILHGLAPWAKISVTAAKFLDNMPRQLEVSS